MTAEQSDHATERDAREDLPLRLKIHRVGAALRSEYGSGRPRSDRHPTDCLIATILSQHTADRNSGAAYRELKDRFATWQDVLGADTGQLAATIRVAGLANIKAQRIQDALLALESQYGTLDLDFLKDLPLEEARNVLLGLPGIGPKTAACVLLFSCGHPALPVDTHVHRLARRLGLIGQKDSAERAHDELSRLVPLSDVYDFHVNLISHGRQVCHARNPSCDVCILRSDCTYIKQEDHVSDTYDVSPLAGMRGRGTRGRRAAVGARSRNRRVAESGQ